MKSLATPVKYFGYWNFIAGLIWLVFTGRPRRLKTEIIHGEVIFFGYVAGREGFQLYWGKVIEALREKRTSTYLVVDDYKKTVEILDSQLRFRSNQISILIWLKAIRTYFATSHSSPSWLFEVIKREFGHKQVAEQVLFWSLLELSFPRNARTDEHRKFVYLMEGHPWEWTLVRFAQTRGLYTIGYPHTTVNMCQDPIRQHCLLAPQLAPDLIATSGQFVEAALEEVGYLKTSFRSVEVTRFKMPTKGRYKKNPGNFSLADKKLELVLSHIPQRSYDLIRQLETTLGGSRDVTLNLRFHPDMPVKLRSQIRKQAESFGFAFGDFTTGTKLVDAISSAWVNELVSRGIVYLWDPGMSCLSFLYRDPQRFGLAFRSLSTGFVQLSFESHSQPSLERFLCFDEGTKRWMSLL